MHDDTLWVKGEGPTPNEQLPGHKYRMTGFHFSFFENCDLERDRSYWLCGKLCEEMVSVQVCVPVHMQVHWRGERGNLIN